MDENNSPKGADGFEILDVSDTVSQKPKSTPSTAVSGTRRKNKQGNLQEEKPKASIDDYARAFFSCQCFVCKSQIKQGHLLEVHKKLNTTIFKDEEINFRDLIDKLFANSEKIKGAQILFPDTVFFDEGKPLFIARIDKDGCLIKISQQSKLGLQEIRQKFSQIVRDRRKETQLQVFAQNPGAALMFKGAMPPSLQEIEMPNLINIDKKQTNIRDQDDKNIYYRDTVIFRYNKKNQHPIPQQDPVEANQPKDKDETMTTIIPPQTTLEREKTEKTTEKPEKVDKPAEPEKFTTQQLLEIERFEDSYEHVRIVKDTEFINEFSRRPNDTEWLTFNCIQTCIKAKTIGKPLYVQFYAPIVYNENSTAHDKKVQLSKEIEFGKHAKAFPDDITLLKTNTQKTDEIFALKQCFKMAHYIQKVYQYEILQMKAEFLKDENGNIWFFYATNIQGRSRNKKGSQDQVQQAEAKIEEGKQKINEDEELQGMEEELKDYQDENEQIHSGCMKRILGVMDEHYTKMKNDLGLPEMQLALKNEQEGLNDDAVKLDEILHKLRPNTTAANFKEFLQRQDNINKNSHWRKISRKVHPTIEQCSTKDSSQISPRSSPLKNQFFNVMSTQYIHQGVGGPNVLPDEGKSSQGGNFNDPREQRMKIQQLLQTLDAKNSEGNAYQTKKLLQNMSSQKQSLIADSSHGMSEISLSPSKTAYFSQNKLLLANQLNTTGTLADRKHRSYMKAELVRRQLLSRGDLIKLYQPPIPMNQLPYTNPFYTKTIISSKQKAMAATSASPFIKNFNKDSDYNPQRNEGKKQVEPFYPDQETNAETRYILSSGGAQGIEKPQLISQSSPYNNTEQYFNKRRSMQTARNDNTASPQVDSRGGLTIALSPATMTSVGKASRHRFSMQMTDDGIKRQYQQQELQQYNEMLDWSKFQGNKNLQRQIAKRMEYLKVQDTFKPHQGIQGYKSSYASGQHLHKNQAPGSQPQAP